MDAPNLLTIEGRGGGAQVVVPPPPPLAAGEGSADGREGNADRDKFDQSASGTTAAGAAEASVGGALVQSLHFRGIVVIPTAVGQ